MPLFDFGLARSAGVGRSPGGNHQCLCDTPATRPEAIPWTALIRIASASSKSGSLENRTPAHRGWIIRTQPTAISESPITIPRLGDRSCRRRRRLQERTSMRRGGEGSVLSSYVWRRRSRSYLHLQRWIASPRASRRREMFPESLMYCSRDLSGDRRSRMADCISRQAR
jgi:hypothetical protein